MKFSIIIPLRKVNDYIREAMPHYKNQTFKDFEIIVVSEADETEKFLNTKIIKVGQVPPSEKRNIGVKNAKGEILAFIDDDAYPDKDWLKNAAEIFKDKEISAFGGPSLIPHNATFFQKVSNKVYELSSRKTGIRYGEHKGRREIDDWPTCNFFVRKSDFKKTKGFDSKYWGGEDTQLCYSLVKLGKKIMYDPEVIIYHHPRKTLKQHLKQTYFWGVWRGFFMRIHRQSRQLTFFIPPMFVLWLVFGVVISLFSSYFRYIYFTSLGIYLLYLFILGFKSKSIMLSLPVVLVTFLTHLAYGIGFFRGVLSKKSGPMQKTLNPSEGLKIKKT